MPQFIWQNNYTWDDIKFRHVRLFIYRLAALVSLWLALIALIIFSVSIWEQGNLILDMFVPSFPTAKIFWLSLLLAGYTWYRFDREKYWYPALIASQETVAVDNYLTEDVWIILEQAYRYAHKVAHAKVSPLHLLAGALKDQTVIMVLVRLGVDIGRLTDVLRHTLAKEEQGQMAQLSDEGKKVFTQAAALALQRKTKHLESTELLLALVMSQANTREVIEEMAIEPSAVANVTAWFTWRRRLFSQHRNYLRLAKYRPKHALDRAYLAIETPFLYRVASDLTSAAARGYLAPCLARETELEQIYHIIQGGQQSVILVGETGVGKKTLVEGLAQAMAADEVPSILQDKHLYALSLAKLLSGTTPAEAGARLWRSLVEIIRAGNIILVISEIEQLINQQAESGQLGLSDILANAVSEYGLLIIATTTPPAWRNLQEGSSLGQVFQPVEVKELDLNGTIQVLESHLPRLEYKHRVFF
ncbi:MAG: ATP-dependent Clp protease ATP-binding subunit [Candidatus Kerfeldbacteria bacterium]|nr:ATP-dependent Clp protease ATP-binding subunit [Candidatus Kerfeldbacteria bacterium]